MAYNKTNWQNAPSTDTPINANNLNKIEEGIYQNSLKADQVGDLSNLETTNKSTIVGAINELKDGDIYSKSQETLTNKVCGGKPVYRAYIEYSHSSTGSYTYNHNLGIGEVVSINGYCTISGQTVSSHGYRQFPQIDTSTGYMFAINNITENSITTKATGWQNNHIYIWIEYTKSS